MRTLILICLCLPGFAAIGQSRYDIVTRKILSIRMTFSSNNVVIQNYYSKTGDDSLQFYNGRLQYVFKPTSVKNGKVMQLKRYDTRGREQESQLYTYNSDSTYSIEIFEPVKGTMINKTHYSPTHRILYNIDRNMDTTQFYYSPAGKLVRAAKKTREGETIDFTVDPQGNEYEWLARFISNPQMEVSYSYQKAGLISEMTTESAVRKNTVYYSYEFY